MAGVSNEAQTFAAVITYFMMVTFLIGLSPLSGACPSGGTGDKTCNFVTFTSSSSCTTTSVWSSTVSYNQNDCVTYSSNTYQSSVNNNLNNIPSDSPSFWVSQSALGSGFGVVAKVGTGIACAAAGAAAILGAIPSFGLSLGLAGVACGAFIFTALAPKTTAEAIGTFVNAVSDFLFVFFELITFQLPIPAFLNLLIIAPGASPVVYIGVKILRGGG